MRKPVWPIILGWNVAVLAMCLFLSGDFRMLAASLGFFGMLAHISVRRDVE